MRRFPSSLFVLLVACGRAPPGAGSVESIGVGDASEAEAASPEAGRDASSEAGANDEDGIGVSTVEAGQNDASGTGLSATDAEASVYDATEIDTNVLDAGPVDASSNDASPEAGPEAGPIDANDAGTIDASDGRAPTTADNPPVPTGYELLPQADLTAAMTAWATSILNDPTDYPLFATASQTFGTLMVLARVEWQPPDFQNAVVHRGVTLYEPL
jgi:hypothetical protein